MRAKMVISVIIAVLALTVFVSFVNNAAYPVLLILFLISSAFFYNAVRLYGKAHPQKERTAVRIYLWVLFLSYLTFLFLLTFFVRRNTPQFILNDLEELKMYLKNRTNFIPFKTITGILRGSESMRYVIVNIAGNLAAAAPLGFFLPLLIRPARRFVPFAMTASLIVVFIELTQMCFCVGSCDIDDLILNVAGAVVIFLLLKIPAVKKVTETLFVL